MTKIVSVKFKDNGRSYYFDPDNHIYKEGETVIVETANGLSAGFISKGNFEVEDEKITNPLKKVLRSATERDLEKLQENARKEKEAFAVCEKKILEHNLEMKLVTVEYSFDASKIVFFFTADGRVDFRDLVKDLAATFHSRIELRQIGVRDEARMLGGIGICGQPYCCKKFLTEFQPVSIKMAKEQGLSLNPTKISGSCGRLMCCLKYEQDSYEYLISVTPAVGSKVKTPEGVGFVTDANLLTGDLVVRPNNDEGVPYKIHRSKVKSLSPRKSGPKEQKTSDKE